MHEKHRTSTLALVAAITVTTAVAGVFGFSTGLAAWTERTYAVAAARPLPDAFVPLPPPAPLPRYRLMPARAVTRLRLPAPIERASERVTKKPFGLEVHPATSPVPNDKFDGIHVGMDFETFDDEQDAPVGVYAICDGPLLFKKWARGYGGVAVQGCRIRGEEVSVIYGHLDVDTVLARQGERLRPGDLVGGLGAGHSQQTDGARKHLHLGIRLGTFAACEAAAPDCRSNDIRGYVKDEAEEEQFIDPAEVLDLE